MKLLFILSLALILRLISLNQSFWLDEATSVTVARDLSFQSIITQFSPGDFHPPLYYLMLKVWLSIFGISEISARSLSIVFALGTIAVVYKIGANLANKKVGIVACLLLALAPLHIYYSQEARMYAALTFFASTSVLFFLTKRWSLFAIFLLATVATDYIGILMLPIFWLFGLLNSKKFHWRSFLVAHAPLLLFGLVWLPYFTTQFQSGLNIKDTAWGQIIGVSSIKAIALVVVKFAIGRISFDNNLIYAGTVSAALVAISIPLLSSLKNFQKTKFLWTWLIVPILLSLAISIKVPIFYYFRLLFCLPALYLLLAFGLSKIRNSRIIFTLIIFLNTIFSLYYIFHTDFHRENWRELTTFISKDSKDTTRTLFVANSQMEAYKYYAPNHNISWGVQGAGIGYDTIWLMRYVQDIFDPSDKVRKYVEELGYKKIGEYDFNGILVYRYKNE